MARTTSVAEARRNLDELLNMVSLMGDEIVMERAGMPIVRLTA